ALAATSGLVMRGGSVRPKAYVRSAVLVRPQAVDGQRICLIIRGCAVEAFLLLNSRVRIGVAKTGGDAQRQKVVIKIAWRTLRVPGAGIALRLRALAAQKTCEKAGR